MNHEERMDNITAVGLQMAVSINKRVDGPRDAIGALSVALARILVEFPEDEWPEVFENIESLSRAMVPALDSILIRAKQS